MKKFKIYCLKCPISKEIRYIGVTTQKLSVRLSQHIWDSKKRSTMYKSNWINSLSEKPLIELIEEVNELNWEEREIYWINFYKSGKLTNYCKGGKGVVIDRHSSGKERSAKAKYKKVLQISKDKVIIKEWESPTIAAKELGISRMALQKCCSKSKNNIFSYGFYWVYLEEYLKEDFKYKIKKDISERKDIKKVYFKNLETNEIGIYNTIIEAATENNSTRRILTLALKKGTKTINNKILSFNQKDIV